MFSSFSISGRPGKVWGLLDRMSTCFKFYKNNRRCEAYVPSVFLVVDEIKPPVMGLMALVLSRDEEMWNWERWKGKKRKKKRV